MKMLNQKKEYDQTFRDLWQTTGSCRCICYKLFAAGAICKDLTALGRRTNFPKWGIERTIKLPPRTSPAVLTAVH